MNEFEARIQNQKDLMAQSDISSEEARKLRLEKISIENQERTSRKESLLRESSRILTSSIEYKKIIDDLNNPKLHEALKTVWNMIGIYSLGEKKLFKEREKTLQTPNIRILKPQVRDWMPFEKLVYRANRSYSRGGSRVESSGVKKVSEYGVPPVNRFENVTPVEIVKDALLVGGNVGWSASSSLVGGKCVEYIHSGGPMGGLRSGQDDSKTEVINHYRELSIFAYHSRRLNEIGYAVQSNCVRQSGFQSTDSLLDFLVENIDRLVSDRHYSLPEGYSGETGLWYLKDELSE